MTQLPKIKIEKNIPAPYKHGANLPKNFLTDALKSLQVGDSFTLPSNLKASLYYAAKKSGIKTTIHEASKGEQVRIWRVQ